MKRSNAMFLKKNKIRNASQTWGDESNGKGNLDFTALNSLSQLAACFDGSTIPDSKDLTALSEALIDVPEQDIGLTNHSTDLLQENKIADVKEDSSVVREKSLNFFHQLQLIFGPKYPYIVSSFIDTLHRFLRSELSEVVLFSTLRFIFGDHISILRLFEEFTDLKLFQEDFLTQRQIDVRFPTHDANSHKDISQQDSSNIQLNSLDVNSGIMSLKSFMKKIKNTLLPSNYQRFLDLMIDVRSMYKTSQLDYVDDHINEIRNMFQNNSDLQRQFDIFFPLADHVARPALYNNMYAYGINKSASENFRNSVRYSYTNTGIVPQSVPKKSNFSPYLHHLDSINAENSSMFTMPAQPYSIPSSLVQGKFMPKNNDNNGIFQKESRYSQYEFNDSIQQQQISSFRGIQDVSNNSKSYTSRGNGKKDFVFNNNIELVDQNIPAMVYEPSPFIDFRFVASSASKKREFVSSNLSDDPLELNSRFNVTNE